MAGASVSKKMMMKKMQKDDAKRCTKWIEMNWSSFQLW